MSDPILIVGAGPVGLTAALTLQLHGVPFRLIDKLPGRTIQSRAAGNHPRALEVWEHLGVIDPLLRRGIKLKGIVILDDDDKELVRAQIEAADSAYSYILGLGQGETERILTEALAAQDVHIERKVELLSFTQDGTVVHATLKHDDGRTESFQTPYLIGCDGAHSTVRKGLGLPMEGDTLDMQWQTADVKMDWDNEGDFAIIKFSSQGFAFLVRIEDGRWRVALGAIGVRVEKPEDLTLDMVQDLLTNKMGIKARLYDPVWTAPFNINTRMAPKLNVGRVFITGDACHVHSPLGAQGMNTGIQDAYNLAWKLAYVMKGYATQTFAQSYHDERHANAKRLLELVGPLSKAASLSAPMAMALRNSAMSFANIIGVTHLMGRRMSQLDVHYRDSPIVAEHMPSLKGWLHSTLSGADHPGIGEVAEFKHGPHPGERAPDVLIMRNEKDQDVRLLQEWIKETRYRCLIFTGSHPRAERIPELIQFGQRIERASNGLIRARIIRHAGVSAASGLWDVTGVAHRRYGASYECLYLVRPDGYVGFRSQPVEWEALMGFLQKNAFAPGVLRDAKQPA